MIEYMTDYAKAVVGYVGSGMAVLGAVLAQASATPEAGNASQMIGMGGLAAALAMLVTSFGDKVGPHVVAIAKLLIENREVNIRLKSENLTLAQNILELKERVSRAEEAAAKAASIANENENLLIEAKARADRRFEKVEALAEDAHRKAGGDGGSGDAIPSLPESSP